jgi:hypothetical protein
LAPSLSPKWPISEYFFIKVYFPSFLLTKPNVFAQKQVFPNSLFSQKVDWSGFYLYWFGYDSFTQMTFFLRLFSQFISLIISPDCFTSLVKLNFCDSISRWFKWTGFYTLSKLGSESFSQINYFQILFYQSLFPILSTD